MADWSAIRSALEAWLGTVTGLPHYWRRRPRGWVSEDSGYLLLDLTGRTTVGTDEVALEYDATAADGEEFTPWQLGQRRFTCQVQVRTWRTDDDVDALHYTSLIRDSLRLPSAVAAFAAADLGFAQVLTEVELPDQQDGREMSVAQIDLSFNTIASRSDTTHGYVETIESTMQAPQGTDRWSGDFEVG